MAINVETLITKKTSATALSEVLALMSTAKFLTTSWESGSLGLAFATTMAELYARIYNATVIPSLKLAFNDTAKGTGLSWFSQSHYDNTRIGGVTTRGTLTLTDSNGSGPFNIAAGQFVCSDANDSSLTFRSNEAIAVPFEGSDTIEIECEQAGELGNLPNARITEMVTTIAGLTITNGTSGGATWITRNGVNEEADSTLQQRNETKWASLSPSAPINAYKNMVLSATDGVGDPVGITKVAIDASNPSGPGTLTVYIANTSATATSQQVTDVQAFIDDGRKAPNAIPTVTAASEVTIDITGTLTCSRGYGTAANTAFQAAVTSYIAGLDIGGDQVDGEPGGNGYVLLSTIIDLAREQSGVLDYVSALPLTNQDITKSQLATVGTFNITLVEV